MMLVVIVAVKMIAQMIAGKEHVKSKMAKINNSLEKVYFKRLYKTTIESSLHNKIVYSEVDIAWACCLHSVQYIT